MNLNPYQSPATSCTPTAADAGVRVDGRQLVVRSGVVLPQVCVKTNEPVSPQDMIEGRLSWCSPIVGLLILLSGFLLILVYFIVRQKCIITFGLSPALRRKYYNRRMAKIVAVVVLFLALPFVAGVDSTPLIIVVFVLFLASVVSLFVGNSPLKITEHHKGQFWIAGCSKDFLACINS